jgi:probable rRNA maturation factor
VIVNLQRKIRLSVDDYTKFVERLIEKVPEVGDGEFAIAFVSDRRMEEINTLFRSQRATTDVLSFPYVRDEYELALYESNPEEGNGRSYPPKRYLGDIVISVEQAKRQAKAARHSFKREVQQLILHGVLHLCGYDHETDNGEMNARELELRRILRIE